MPKGKPNKRYLPEFKQLVVETIKGTAGIMPWQKSELLYLQRFRSMEHVKRERFDDLDHYNDQRIKTKRKGLPPAMHRQQALSAA